MDNRKFLALVPSSTAEEIEAAIDFPLVQAAKIAKASGLEAFKECIAALTILQKLYFTEHPVEHADK